MQCFPCFHCLDRGPNENDLALGSDRYGGLNFASTGGVEHDELRARSGATSEKERERERVNVKANGVKQCSVTRVRNALHGQRILYSKRTKYLSKRKNLLSREKIFILGLLQTRVLVSMA